MKEIINIINMDVIKTLKSGENLVYKVPGVEIWDLSYNTEANNLERKVRGYQGVGLKDFKEDVILKHFNELSKEGTFEWANPDITVGIGKEDEKEINVLFGGEVFQTITLPIIELADGELYLSKDIDLFLMNIEPPTELPQKWLDMINYSDHLIEIEYFKGGWELEKNEKVPTDLLEDFEVVAAINIPELNIFGGDIQVNLNEPRMFFYLGLDYKTDDLIFNSLEELVDNLAKNEEHTR